MKVIVVRKFSILDKEFEKGQVLEMPIHAFLKLKEKGLIDFLNQEKQNLNQAKLNRLCFNCECKEWLILKPNSKASAIQCLSCGHIELYLRI